MHTLPVTAFRSKITEAVQSNPVTIIVAETGAGKSTQVPQFLLEDGWRLVVTQPRRLAARSLAERVAFEQKTRLGHVIGYRTSQERRDSSKTRVLFFTDRLSLLRELVGKSKRDVLFIQAEEREIAERIRDLSRSRIKAEILPLQGDLTPAEQGRCFKPYPKP